MRPAFEQFRHEPRVQRVAGFVRDQSAQHRLADQCKIPEQIENLVTHELIRKPQRSVVQHPVSREHNRILQRSTANKTAGLQFLNFVVEAERPCRRDEVRIVRSRELDVQALLADQRVREIDIVTDTERIGRINAERLFAFLQNELFSNSNVLADAILSQRCRRAR